MRLPSPKSKSVRATPQQERAERRLAGFLNVAAKLFAELGYEQVTMTDIADQSGSSIGALYKYFPDKQAIAYTLAVQLSKELEERWRPLIEQAADFTHREFARLFIDRIIAFVQDHPAYLALVAAPVRFKRDPAARKASRLILAEAFVSKNASLSKEQAFVIAGVSLQIVRGMMTDLADSHQKAKTAIILEYRKALTLYLRQSLSGKATR